MAQLGIFGNEEEMKAPLSITWRFEEQAVATVFGTCCGDADVWSTAY